MDRRAPAVLAALLTLLASGCPRERAAPAPMETPPPEPAVAVEPPSMPSPAESTGLVGTDVQAERVELADEGPRGNAIVFLASVKGYTEPCGCTLDLVLGGIDRVTGAVQSIRALSNHALVLDGGGWMFERPTLDDASRPQALRKLEVIEAAVRAIGVRATVPGPSDLANGAAFYLERASAVGVAVVAANLAPEGDGAERFGQAFVVESLGDQRVGVIGLVDPARFEGVAGAVAGDPTEALSGAVEAARAAGATTVVVLWHGDLVAARRVFASASGVDFIVIGAEPAHTDAVETIGAAVALQAHDQGRVVGWLKLVPGGDGASPWENARIGSSEERAQLERVIAGIESQIAELSVPEGSAEPPIVARQRARVEGLRQQLAGMAAAAPTFAEGADAFLYRPIDMVPGLAPDPAITEAMRLFNRSLREINLAAAAPPVPAADGMPTYAGGTVCARCHPVADRFWKTTHHAGAWQTLVERDKDFDRECVGCHVTGYQQPGGSTLGHTDRLQDVQCEQCHGPGSLHAQDPINTPPALNVVRQTTEATCTTCHNHEHSPRFDYATYLPRVLGEGHGR